MKIGFIGQGFIGKNYADDFEKRGFEVVRYALEEPYVQNKDKIRECDITFIAVPTPSTPNGFDDSIIDEALQLIGKDNIAVIKSTILPGTTEKFQERYPGINVLHSPEFLTEKTANYDAEYPDRNIIGYPDKQGEIMAHEVMNVLPNAGYRVIIPAKEAEMVKYGGNCWFYFKVIYMNMVYDLCKNLDINFETVKKAMQFDPRIGPTHLDVVHQGGRGAGGHCFIKDFAAFARLYDEVLANDDILGASLLELMEEKNKRLLRESGKDLDLLKGVYGKETSD